MVLEDVADHEHALRASAASSTSSSAVGTREGERLLDEDVLAGQQRLARQLVVLDGGRGDGHRLRLRVLEEILELRR